MKDFVAVSGEEVADQFADRGFVLDDKDGLVAAANGFFDMSRLGRSDG